MEQYISWGIVAILVIVMILLAYVNKDYRNVFMDALINVVRENEAFVVQAIYNRLPDSIKKNVGSKEIAKIVEYILDDLVGILEKYKTK